MYGFRSQGRSPRFRNCELHECCDTLCHCIYHVDLNVTTLTAAVVAVQERLRQCGHYWIGVQLPILELKMTVDTVRTVVGNAAVSWQRRSLRPQRRLQTQLLNHRGGKVMKC